MFGDNLAMSAALDSIASYAFIPLFILRLLLAFPPDPVPTWRVD